MFTGNVYLVFRTYQYHLYTNTCDQPLHCCDYRRWLLLASAVSSIIVIVRIRTVVVLVVRSIRSSKVTRHASLPTVYIQHWCEAKSPNPRSPQPSSTYASFINNINMFIRPPALTAQHLPCSQRGDTKINAVTFITKKSLKPSSFLIRT